MSPQSYPALFFNFLKPEIAGDSWAMALGITWFVGNQSNSKPISSTVKAFSKETKAYPVSAESLSRQRSSAALTDGGDDP